jgi:hypothetical protein
MLHELIVSLPRPVRPALASGAPEATDLRAEIFEKFQHDAPGRLAANGDVEKHYWVTTLDGIGDGALLHVEA